MAFPLGTVLAAAPGIISAAADIIKLVRNRQNKHEPQQEHDPRLEELIVLIEKQAVIIEELAKNNNELALAVRNNRILSMLSVVIAGLALMVIFLR